MASKPYGIYLALLHHPITNRHGKIITTSVTNMDIHDISRSCRTYGVNNYFIANPIPEQHEVVGRILDHWSSESSREFHPDRVEAVSLVKLAKDFEEVKKRISEDSDGKFPEVVLTDARTKPKAQTYKSLREELPEILSDRPLVLVFGTGWGVAETFYPEVHRVLAPVYGPEGESGYNHLSVRAAVAAILDRLFGN